jgi:hypothetical protein
LVFLGQSWGGVAAVQVEFGDALGEKLLDDSAVGGMLYLCDALLALPGEQHHIARR